MILSKAAWYSKAYYFIQGWWAYSRDRKYEGKAYEKRSINNADICTFMRAFIIKLPFLIFVHLFMYWVLYLTFFHVPITYLGLSGWFTIVLIILGIVGLGVSAWFVAKKCSRYFKTKPKKFKTEPTMWDLIRTRIQARHDKICILMTFEDKEAENDQSN